MSTQQIPPDGVAAEFGFSIPAPAGMDTLGGVRLYFAFEDAPPGTFVPQLFVGGVRRELSGAGSGPSSLTFIAQLPTALPAPATAALIVNGSTHLEPGNDVTVYAWGAQTESGTGALNPDEGGEPSVMTDTIEVGRIEVLTWPEWNRLTGANQGEPTGS